MFKFLTMYPTDWYRLQGWSFESWNAFTSLPVNDPPSIPSNAPFLKFISEELTSRKPDGNHDMHPLTLVDLTSDANSGLQPIAPLAKRRPAPRTTVTGAYEDSGAPLPHYLTAGPV